MNSSDNKILKSHCLEPCPLRGCLIITHIFLCSPLNPTSAGSVHRPEGDFKIALQKNIYNKWYNYEFKNQITKVCYRARKENESQINYSWKYFMVKIKN